jgi:hypothetical protein
VVKTDSGLMPLGDILNQTIPRPIRPQLEAETKAPKPLSRVQSRLLEPCPEHELYICFQYRVLCQTGLPYRNPKGLRFWQRQQAFAALEIEADRAFDPTKDEWVNVRLPGPKPRLVLAHLNAEALRLDSPK